MIPRYIPCKSVSHDQGEQNDGNSASYIAPSSNDERTTKSDPNFSHLQVRKEENQYVISVVDVIIIVATM